MDPAPGEGEQFIGEPLEPVGGPLDVHAMARGEPALPAAFRWRDEDYVVAEVLRRWKQSGRGRGGGTYLRKHWYAFRTNGGAILTVYFERQARGHGPVGTRQRWWLYTLRPAR